MPSRKGTGAATPGKPGAVPEKPGAATPRKTGAAAPRKAAARKGGGKKSARDYRHGAKALQRPESGAQDIFPAAKRKPAAALRYDSSLAPEMRWDEAAARSEGEKHIAEILAADTLEQAQAAARRLKAMSAPFLNWAGKAEREGFAVPSLPLFTHERLSTHAVLETLKRRHPKRGATLQLFGEGDKSIGDKIAGAYAHLNGWQNRMILGDSLQVMNSLLQYENLGGGVQMIYMDPPYGIKFGSNFQPFVRRRDVKDGDDESISREPEMVQAYRDTWELGIHSWLTYMRDRLLLARDLLAASGSCFVQISDENVHHVREVMDEVFGAENFVSEIVFRKTSNLTADFLPTSSDFILWYAKDRALMKFHRLFEKKSFQNTATDSFGCVELPDGSWRRLTSEEKMMPASLPKEWRLFALADLTSSHYYESPPFEFEGVEYTPKNRYWSTSIRGLERLAKAKRLAAVGETLRYKRYFNDFSVRLLNNVWGDTGAGTQTENRIYVVQTSEKVIQRCMLMVTDPGDLVLDPTCGSGTTAFVAEQWGRRWITMDASRVPLALARQRLLTATFPYYRLMDPQRGPAGGFVYERKQNRKGEEVGGLVPHITLRSIANNEPPATEVLVDRPAEESNTCRITGPFCVEAVLPTPLSPDMKEATGLAEDSASDAEKFDHFTRMLEALKQSPELLVSGGKNLQLAKVRATAKAMNLHAEAESKDGKERFAVMFGPANGAVSERAIVDAIKEARNKDYARLLVVAVAIEPQARATVAQSESTLGRPATYAAASTDLVMGDLLKNTRSSQLFAIVALPDISLEKTAEKAEDGADLWQVTLNGLDSFDPTTMDTHSLKGDDVPCWMLDTDYDGQCFRAGQIFFPRTGAWDKIRNSIRADFDEAVWERLRGNVSAPFIAGEQIAVKVLDERGNELLVVKRVEEEARP